MNNLAVCYNSTGQLDRALALWEETMPLRKAKLGADHAQTLRTTNNLANAYRDARRFDRELPLRRELAELSMRKAGADSIEYAGGLAAVGLNLLQQEKWTEAEPVLRDALTIRETKQPDDWRTFNTKSMLGGALLGQKKYQDAEPLLRAGSMGNEAAGREDPARKPNPGSGEALDRLIPRFAVATNKPGRGQDVEGWRRRTMRPSEGRRYRSRRSRDSRA